VREALAEAGLAKSQIVLLDALLKLRQACCDPALVKLPGARQTTRSAKRDALIELLATLAVEGRKALVFSQFTSST
jgi:SNF2 family DNA or RNA helicase